MLELIAQLVGEFLLQVVGETLFNLGLHALAEPFRTRPQPWLAALGYVAFGLAFGGLSLLVVRHHLTPPGMGRLLTLGLAPVAAGLAMAGLGAWRAGRDDEVLRIDRFSYGYLFALAFALVRFRFAT